MFRKDGVNRYSALYHKMDDYRLKDDGSQGLLLTTSKGETTHFNRDGIEDWLETGNGYRSYFNITRYGKYYQLNSLCGESEGGVSQCIEVKYATGPGIGVTVKSLAANGKPFVVSIKGESEVRDISVRSSFLEKQVTSSNGLPLVSLPQEASNTFDIHYVYQGSSHPNLLTNILYPTGSKEELQWGFKAMKLMDGSGGSPAQYLPVVVSKYEYPDSRKPTEYYTTHYRYGVQTHWDASGSHNYLGYDAEHPEFVRGEDNLMERGGLYYYSTEEKANGLSTIRTYNRFHLLVDEKEYGGDIRLLKENFQSYQNVVHLSMAPTWYSLPLSEEEKVYDEYALPGLHRSFTDTLLPSPLVLSTSASYDKLGNLIESSDNYGTLHKSTYCPLAGNKDCPRLSKSDFPFETLEEGGEVIPPKKANNAINRRGFNSSPAGETIYTKKEQNHYKELRRHRQSGLAKTVSDLTYPVIGTETRGYVDKAGSYHILGTEKSHYVGDEFTLKQGQSTDLESDYGLLSEADYADGVSHLNNRVITHKNYSTLGTTLTMEAMMRTVDAKEELPLGKLAMNLLTGYDLYQEDSQHIRTAETYDSFSRVTSETISPPVRHQFGTSEGHLQPQTTHYEYYIADDTNMLLEADPLGNEVKVIYDGLGRKITDCHLERSSSHFLRSVASEDTTCQTGGWVLDDSYQYDKNYDRLLSETRYYLQGLNKQQVPVTETPAHSTVSYRYDSDGRVESTQSSNGERALLVYDDTLLGEISLGYSEKNGAVTFAPMIEASYANTQKSPIDKYKLSTNVMAKRDDGNLLYTADEQSDLQEIETRIKAGKPYQEALLEWVRLVTGLDGQGNDNSLVHEHNTYDPYGNLVETQDRKHLKQKETMAYTPAGALASETDPQGNVTTYQYDGQGDLLSKTLQPQDKNVAPLTPGYQVYNDLGQLVETELGDRKVTRSEHYDHFGRVDESTLQNGTRISIVYNEMGMITDQYVQPQGGDKRHALHIDYDPVSWEVTATYDNTGAGLVTYNRQGLPIATWHRHEHLPSDDDIAVTISLPDSHDTIAYDEFNQPTLTASTVYASDGKTPLTSWTSWGESNAFGEPVYSYDQGLDGVVQTVASYTYDDLHRISKVTDQDNFTHSTTYDARGNIASTEDTTASGIMHWQYGYNDQGDMISIARQTPMGSSMISYSYDLLNNLSDYHCQGGRMGQSLCPVETDTLGLNRIRLGSRQPLHLQSQHYTFDAFNDIQTVLETLVTSDGKKVDKRVTYTYDPANLSHRLRLLHDQWQWDYGHGYGAAIKPADDLVYNADGQVIRDMNGDHLSYNDLGQMSAYQGVGQAISTAYAYNAQGVQVREVAPHQAPLYKFYDGDALTLAVQADSDGKQHTTSLRGAYHYVDGKVSEIFESGLNDSVDEQAPEISETELNDSVDEQAPEIFKSGLNTSVAAILSPAGKLTEQVLYTPYGLRSEVPASGAVTLAPTNLPDLLRDITWGFNGEVTDQLSGYQLLGKGYRGYNPKLRRFMQHDVASPFGVGGINGYAYVGNNPIMHTDPTGHGYQDDIDEGDVAADEAKHSLIEEGMNIGGVALGGVGALLSIAAVVAVFAGMVTPVGWALAPMMIGAAANLAASSAVMASGGLGILADKLPNISADQRDQFKQASIGLGLAATGLSFLGITATNYLAPMIIKGAFTASGGIFRQWMGVATAKTAGVFALESAAVTPTAYALAKPDEPPEGLINYAMLAAGFLTIFFGALTTRRSVNLIRRKKRLMKYFPNAEHKRSIFQKRSKVKTRIVRGETWQYLKGEY